MSRRVIDDLPDTYRGDLNRCDVPWDDHLGAVTDYEQEDEVDEMDGWDR